jgi:hypothetical protein
MYNKGPVPQRWRLEGIQGENLGLFDGYEAQSCPRNALLAPQQGNGACR